MIIKRGLLFLRLLAKEKLFPTSRGKSPASSLITWVIKTPAFCPLLNSIRDRIIKAFLKQFTAESPLIPFTPALDGHKTAKKIKLA